MCSWRDSVSLVSSGLCSTEHRVVHFWRSFGGIGRTIRLLMGGVVVCVWIRPRSEERCRERWMRWWSENPEVLRVVVVVCEGAAWCGSCMAKWSIDDSDV